MSAYDKNGTIVAVNAHALLTVKGSASGNSITTAAGNVSSAPEAS